MFYMKFKFKGNRKTLHAGVKYSVHDVICEVINYCARNIDIYI